MCSQQTQPPRIRSSLATGTYVFNVGFIRHERPPAKTQVRESAIEHQPIASLPLLNEREQTYASLADRVTLLGKDSTMTEQELKSLKDQVAVLQFDRIVANEHMVSLTDALEEFLDSGANPRPFREIQKAILARRLNRLAAGFADENHSFASLIKKAIDKSLDPNE